MPLLFSYGTLQQKNVQLANFGRELTGQTAILPGYILGTVTITDERVLRESGKAVHPILCYTGKHNDEISGTVFTLTEQELLQADDYEVAEYKRVSATLNNGTVCWIYAAANAAVLQE